MICDFAETYHVFDYRQFPATYSAILAKGLSRDSRIKRLYTGVEVTEDYLLNSLIFDRLNLLLWVQTKDGMKGKNKPVSLYETLTNDRRKEKEEGFETSEEFEEKRKQLLTSIKRGGKVIG